MNDLFLQHQLHQFLCGRRHILETLSEGNYGESHSLQVLDHLNCSPAVEGDLTDVELLSEALDVLLDKTVVHDIAFGGHEKALALPNVIWHMVAPNP